MKRLLKWFAIGLAGLVLLAVVAAAAAFLASERITRRTYDLPLTSIPLPTDSSSLSEGQRLARIRGCYDGCHGDKLDGDVFIDDPMLARLVAPNLTRVAARYSDAELERVIRHGIRPNGRSALGMPSSMFYHLSDADLGAIIAFIRAAPVTDGPETEVRLGPLARVGLVLGKYKPQAEEIDHDAPRMVVSDTSDHMVFGKYLAVTSCSECHGTDLKGRPDDPAPSLVVAAAYSDDAFARLMRTGIAVGDRELRLMSDVARSRFAYFTDGEIRALHGYLRALASEENRQSTGARDPKTGR